MVMWLVCPRSSIDGSFHSSDVLDMVCSVRSSAVGAKPACLPEVLQHSTTAANTGSRQPPVSPASTTLPFNKQSYFPGQLIA